MTRPAATRRAARAALAHRPFEDDDDDEERPIGDPDEDEGVDGDEDDDDDDDDEEPMQLAACSARPVGRAACRRGQ